MSGRPSAALNDQLVRPPLRYRRFGGGYRREDVDLLLAELRLTLRALELELGGLRERGRELEGQLRNSRAEIDSYHAKGYELAKVMNSVRDRAAALEQEAAERAAALIADAEEESARRVAEAEARIAELERKRELVLTEVRALVTRVGETIAGAAAAVAETDTASDTVAEAGAGADELQPVENGFPGADLSSLRERLSTQVVLDAGPFRDFDSVADFERELGGLDDVEDVYVRRVKGERAVIELTVVKGTPLLARMRDHLPYRLEVRDRSLDRLVVDLVAAAASQ
jgi:hypothetical protein